MHRRSLPRSPPFFALLLSFVSLFPIEPNRLEFTHAHHHSEDASEDKGEVSRDNGPIGEKEVETTTVVRMMRAVLSHIAFDKFSNLYYLANRSGHLQLINRSTKLIFAYDSATIHVSLQRR